MNMILANWLETFRNPGESDESLRRRIEVGIRRSKPKVTWEKFMDWLDEDTHAEWVNGEVFMNSPVGLQHQRISLFLAHVLGAFVEFNQLGEIVPAPFQMRLANSSREPDLLFVSQAHSGRLKPTYLDGAADLVVEIISPESIGRDRGEKFNEYEAANIPEYWLIDPILEQAECYRLGESGYYQIAFSGAAGKYSSPVLPGLTIEVAWLWKPPAVMEVLRMVGVV